ncbi:MAG: hypothetical protein ACI9UK_000909 [Candidatus Krumholzibacteriia bacterium]
MNKLPGNYGDITALIRSWAKNQEQPLPPITATNFEATWATLCAHNVEASLGPLLSEYHNDSAIRQKIDKSRQRTQLLMLECERILPALTTDSCQPVLLKGVALALTSYAVPSDRWFLDLDILLPAAEVAEACARLESLGYRPLQGLRDPRFYDKYHLHRIMVGPQGAVVELHWDLTLPGSVYRHDVAGVAKRAQKHQLGRLEVLCAAPVDQILHGVYQNIADGFVDLRRTLDTVLLIEQMQDSDWEYLVTEAHKTNMDRGLWISLHMMKLISGYSVPPAVMAGLQPDSFTRRVAHGLELDRGCVERKGQTSGEYVQMLHLLSTPPGRPCCRELVRSLWLDEGMLLDQGYRPNQLPGIVTRLVLSLRRLKILVFVGWRVTKAFV